MIFFNSCFSAAGFSGYGYFQTTSTTQAGAPAGSSQTNGVHHPNILQQQAGEETLLKTWSASYQNQAPPFYSTLHQHVCLCVHSQAADSNIFTNMRESNAAAGFGRNDLTNHQLSSHITQPCSTTSPAVVAQALSGRLVVKSILQFTLTHTQL